MIREELGVNLTLGLSNISFGLPDRTAINAAFLSMAVLSGLTCAIIDPTVWEMRRAALLGDLLLGKDEDCLKYIAVTGRKVGGEAGAMREPAFAEAPASDLERLKAAVIEGKRREAEDLTRQALEQGDRSAGDHPGNADPGPERGGGAFRKPEDFRPGNDGLGQGHAGLRGPGQAPFEAGRRGSPAGDHRARHGVRRPARHREKPGEIASGIGRLPGGRLWGKTFRRSGSWRRPANIKPRWSACPRC